MKHTKRLLLVIMICAFSMGAAAYYTPDVSEAIGRYLILSERLPVSLQRSYRDSEYIVSATCLDSFPAAVGGMTSRFSVDKVYGGSLEEGEIISLEGSAEVGESYLLYLKNGGGANYAEDEFGYSVVTDGIIPINGETVAYEGESFSLDTLENDIEKQNRVLNVPAQSFYYDSLEALIAECDEILIGRALSVREEVSTPCRSDEKGESVINNLDITHVSIRVLNGVVSAMGYGDTVELALMPSMLHSVINANDLVTERFVCPPVRVEEGDICIFFLIRSGDEKSSCFFPVNPYQGYVKLQGDTIIRPFYNTAFKDIRTLDMFSDIMGELLGYGY